MTAGQSTLAWPSVAEMASSLTWSRAPSRHFGASLWLYATLLLLLSYLATPEVDDVLGILLVTGRALHADVRGGVLALAWNGAVIAW